MIRWSAGFEFGSSDGIRVSGRDPGGRVSAGGTDAAYGASEMGRAEGWNSSCH